MNNAERERAIHLLEYYGEKLGCKTEFDLAIKALELVDNSDKSDDDLISREALKRALEITQYNDIADLIRTERLIDNAPTVCNDNYAMGYQDGVKKVLSERPTGKWLENKGKDLRDCFYTCSQCGRTINVICGETLSDFPFCHCGADMRGGRE